MKVDDEYKKFESAMKTRKTRYGVEEPQSIQSISQNRKIGNDMTLPKATHNQRL